MVSNSNSLDRLGIIAGSLCMIHCIMTPFFFIAKACSTVCCADAPIWWRLIDYIFLAISFIAIYFITNKKTLNWIKIAFWVSWFILLITTLNHTFLIFDFHKYSTYPPATAIIILHFYHLRFNNNSCCNEQNCCP